MGIRVKKNSENKDLSFFSKLIRFIRRHILGVSKAFILESDLEKPYIKNAADLNLSFRLATKKDIEAMDKENYDFDKNAKQYSNDRLEKGDRCILALYNDKIIGYIWTMKDSMEITTFKHFSLSKNKAYLYKAFVLKEFRGKKVVGAIHEYLSIMLKKEGKRFVITAIDIENKSSLKPRIRAGDKIVGKVIHIRFFGLKYDYIKKKDLIYLQN